jgi:uncharacterized membrane protein
MDMDAFAPENVIVVGFADDEKAYEALTALGQLGTQGQVKVEEAAVVVRSDDGRVIVKDQIGDDSLVGTASGGLVGLLIGVLGGPLGVLIGGATGLLAGSLYDLADADDTDSVLTDVSKTVRVGRTALLAQVDEQSPEVVDQAMANLSGTVVRRSVADVEAEIAAAQKAQREAAHKARKELRKERHDKTREEAHAKVEELKAKLPGHHDQKPATTSSSSS